jgi:hypothetical protein
LLRIGLPPSEQADRALLRRTTISVTQPFEGSKDVAACVRKETRDRGPAVAPPWLHLGESGHAATTGAAAKDGISAGRDRSIERGVSSELARTSKHPMLTFGEQRGT